MMLTILNHNSAVVPQLPISILANQMKSKQTTIVISKYLSNDLLRIYPTQSKVSNTMVVAKAMKNNRELQMCSVVCPNIDHNMNKVTSAVMTTAVVVLLLLLNIKVPV